MTAAERARDTLAMPHASHWLKAAILASFDRDPLDALNDCEELTNILTQRANELTARNAISGDHSRDLAHCRARLASLEAGEATPYTAIIEAGRDVMRARDLVRHDAYLREREATGL